MLKLSMLPFVRAFLVVQSFQETSNQTLGHLQTDNFINSRYLIILLSYEK